ncbi:hypothetical protein [Martelella alba]|uniref:Uncharacterized protein n=1 Tax=Martelella alba TaxID=2590451 RepID=A0ABY2SDR8_9HYPH|nr:hypothetical protein [Martelella alba]TKI02735.1 hypothetical protein FCN80_24135 [Martelella alba]
MTKLFIANCSKKNVDFTYRSPDSDKIVYQRIPVGGQIQVYKEATAEALNRIISQHVRYGLIPVGDIPRSRAFVGLCYQFDKPINIDSIINAAHNNDQVLIARGAESRKAAAIAMDRTLAETVPGYAGGAELEVVEEARKNDDAPLMAELISLDEQASVARGRGRSRKR